MKYKSQRALTIYNAGMNEGIEKILEYWFGGFPNAYSADPSRFKMWFEEGHKYDQEIFIQFGAVYQRAVEGGLEHWLDMPRGRLAVIILLDQFSRHIHRGSPEAFAQDTKAQAICLEGIGAGDDLKLHPVERSFFYLPLEHAEDIDKQKYSVQAYNQLLADVPEPHQAPYRELLEWAMKHHYVIESFGRFPELNEILGRENTAEELEFIENKEFAFL
ncbi:MAG: DUF924 domain-containing protein [Gammaproteobacteria bacterium]|nr:DUF924 domain-containing protein [Gammaproteobacteria bacterium]MCW8922343.1 DUF924 domain-containing protein [Gammaproteobacteria bacterium]